MHHDKIANPEILERTKGSLTSKGYNVLVVENKTEALEKIIDLIPEGKSVMNGSSVTLEQIGFVELLKENKHGWVNLHEKVLTKEISRKEATISDYYLGSVHALTEDGKMIIASNTGSQLPHLVFNSENLILVIGAQKIEPKIEDAMKRLYDYVVPLEDKHMMDKYGVGTTPNKVLVFNGEAPMLGRKINIILVKEVLGF